MSSVDDQKQHWTVDKRIPLALIVTIVLQTAGFGVWVGGINNRVASLEEYRLQHMPASSSREGRIIRLETLAQGVAEAIGDIKGTLAEMNRKLDRQTPRP